MDSVEDIKPLLAQPTYVTIVSHRNSDGDALGASLGLYHVLVKHGHTVRIVHPSEHPASFGWMPGIDNILAYDLDEAQAAVYINASEVIFALDFNSLDRIDHVGKIINEHDAKIVLIDHHVDPEPFADFMFSDTNASSTAEMVFDFILNMGWEKDLDLDVINCLYTGIVTDTGSFKHSTNVRIFEQVAMFKRMGLDDNGIQEKIFNTRSEKELKILGHCLANRMEIIPELNAGIIALRKQDYEDFEIARGDTEGIVNYLLTIPFVKVAAFISEQPRLVKLSLRSKGNISVQALARDHFKGGGHVNASGGHSYKPLNSVIKKFKEVLPQYLK